MSDFVKKRGEVIPLEQRQKVAQRYRAIRDSVSHSFSGEVKSLYVGSYGRGTAISTSDIDMLLQLPTEDFSRFANASGNGPSYLLQEIRKGVQQRYPNSDIRADGQVVKVNFKDGMKFEVLPAFWGRPISNLEKYIYPDSNHGGRWRSTNPRSEQDAMYRLNQESNGLLFDTCKHMRQIRDNHFSSYHLSGIVIDSFVYKAIGNEHWPFPGEFYNVLWGSYECQLLGQMPYPWECLYAPGSGDRVDIIDSWECLEKVLRYMAGN